MNPWRAGCVAKAHVRFGGRSEETGWPKDQYRASLRSNYKQVKHELGWADFMVRSDRAIRRHWHLVCCAFSFCWHAWFARRRHPPHRHYLPAARRLACTRLFWPALRPVGGKMGTHSRAAPPCLVAWPVALRRVRAWLDPWTCLWRWWRAWSTAPPPPAIQALLHAVGSGHPLQLYLLD